MRKNTIQKFLLPIMFSIVWNSKLAWAQQYMFHFYNGDVVQTTGTPVINTQVAAPKAPEASAPIAPTSVTATPAPSLVVTPAPVITPTAPLNQIVAQPPANPESEKTKRTGLAIMAGGYGDSYYRGDKFSDLTNQGFRVGLTFVSSYDFNFEVEYLDGRVKGKFNDLGIKDNFKGDVRGLALGARTNYWLTDKFALGLSGTMRGFRGQMSSTKNTSIGGYEYRTGREFEFESYGAGLNVGPVIQLGPVQLQVAYEHNLDYQSLKDASTAGREKSEGEWLQNYGAKAMVSYRF